MALYCCHPGGGVTHPGDLTMSTKVSIYIAQGIPLETALGQNVATAIHEAINFAKLYDTKAFLLFNGIVLRVDKDSSPLGTLEYYYSNFNSSAKR